MYLSQRYQSFLDENSKVCEAQANAEIGYVVIPVRDGKNRRVVSYEIAEIQFASIVKD